MSEEIDYAEMLEIPVATVSVVPKKRRRFPDLKTLAVGKVNERVGKKAPERDPAYAGNEYTEEIKEESEAVPPADGAVPPAEVLEKEPKKRTHPVLIVEFAVACALALGIFLTNVFLPDSAINTFIRSALGTGPKEAVKTYSDFTLTGVVSEYADVEIAVSETGVLSFTGKASVYPACDGTVSSIEKTGDTYTVTIAHSASFQSVYSGLTQAYANKDEIVRANVPFAYSDGQSAVSVSFYQDGEMLDCFSVDAENCLSWNQ